MNQANVLTATPTATCRLHSASTTKVNTMSTKSLKARLTAVESKLNNNKVNTMNTKSVPSNFNTVSVAPQQAVGTMSSMALLDIINGYRLEDGKNNLRHDNFLAKIAKELGSVDALKFKGVYLGDNNEQRKCYFLPEDECMQMAMCESKFVRKQSVKKIRDLSIRVVELETQAPAQHQIPQTLGEALLLAGTLA